MNEQLTLGKDAPTREALHRTLVWIVLTTADSQTPLAHICRSETERDETTLKEIFGEVPVDTKHEEEADKILQSLRQRGEVDFEDGSVHWIEAYSSRPTSVTEERLMWIHEPEHRRWRGVLKAAPDYTLFLLNLCEDRDDRCHLLGAVMSDSADREHTRVKVSWAKMAAEIYLSDFESVLAGASVAPAPAPKEISDVEKAASYYRAAVERQRPPWVPARVRLKARVCGDFPFHETLAEAGEHECKSNPVGAVWVVATNGKPLGVKPQEFEVIQWRENLAPEGGR